MTKLASGRAAWMAEWMVKPAGLMKLEVCWTMFPSRSILTSAEAVISSKNQP
jgi:hypothetical protein